MEIITLLIVLLAGCSTKELESKATVIETIEETENLINTIKQSEIELPIETEELKEVEESTEINIDENQKTEITLEEAIAIGKIEADNYYDNLVLTKAYSYDNDEKRSIEAGANGARQWWYVNFANVALNYVSILIKDGEVEFVHNSDEHGNNGLIDLSKVILTSE